MSRVYEGILKDDRIEWSGESPPPGRPVQIHAIVMNENPDPERGARMAASLSKLAECGTAKKFGDAVQWQRQVRRDRPLSGREDTPNQ
ncbi:MAG: hypothetical protein COV99_12855 [Bacteroidetes bacterium CG12_big_fil_rev_8_21_14_0_65_60_17]|nr:MAG: hypothetical protein COV99_12855 [Bacteroidetes bacterium CG12_big_fil_rev_8_21_14_0_65_60_17]